MSDTVSNKAGAGKHTPGPWRVNDFRLTKDAERYITIPDGVVPWVNSQTPYQGSLTDVQYLCAAIAKAEGRG